MADKKDSKPSSIIEEISASKKYKTKSARLAHAIAVVILLAIMFGVIAGITYGITTKVGLYMDEKEAESSKSHVHLSAPADENGNQNNLPDKVLDVSELAEKVKPAVVTVQIKSEKSDSIFAETVTTYTNFAGVVVAKDEHNFYILVNDSNIEKNDPISVIADNMVLPARFEGKNDAINMSVFTVNFDILDKKDREQIKVLPFANVPLRLGEDIMAIGAPNGLIGSVDAGIVTNVGTIKTLSDINFDLMTSNMVLYEKGSGFIINSSGQICGMMVKSDDVFSFISFVGDTDIIEKFVNTGSIPYAGMVIEKLTAEEAPEGTEGVYIGTVIVDSPAEKAGIRVGDVLLSIENVAISEPDIYKEQMLSRKAGNSLKMKILRDGEEKEVTVNIK